MKTLGSAPKSLRFVLKSALGLGVLFGVSASLSQSANGPGEMPSKKEVKIPGPVVLEKAFVLQFRDALNDKNMNALDISPPAEMTSGPALDELRILAAEGLAHRGHSLSAQLVLQEVAGRALGTTQGLWALYQLDQLAKDFELDESALEEMAYEYDGAVDALSERSMLSWYRAKAYLRRGYPDWAVQELGKVGVDTHWHSDRIFERATEALTDGKADEAEALYEDLLKRTAIRNPTRQFAELNRARLIFEKGDYEAAVAAVRTLDLPTRERARALLEMAWSRYYLKEYGKALGILKVIDSPYFETLRSPETDLLRMVIERDLCRYDLVKKTAGSFRSRYKNSFKQIESRLILEDDSTLKQMALQSRRLQQKATLIFRYRTEKKAVFDEDIRLAPGLHDQILLALTIRERKTEAEIARGLPRELEKSASQLVDLRDQVTFLEYEASIRPFTAPPIEDADYMPIGASNVKYDRIYWPVSNEAWWDELENYEVLIRGRCQEPLPGQGLTPIGKIRPKSDGAGDSAGDEDLDE